MLDDATFARLCAVGRELWDLFSERCRGTDHAYVPADWDGARRALEALRDRARSFVELGSGVGLITVLAERLGYEAYGIEAEPWLVERSIDLAAEFGADCEFVCGSYVPEELQQSTELLEGDFLVTLEANPAYPDLGHELSDFDLVYAFPWPGEEAFFHALFDQAGGPDSLFLTYDASEGYRLYRHGEPEPIERW